MLTSTGTVSTVRSHNVARVSKSHESFGSKFSTVAIDDLVTSDLQAVVKGTQCVSTAVLYLMAEHILGVDAIIHVASPLAHTTTPDVILDVRSTQCSFSGS